MWHCIVRYWTRNKKANIRQSIGNGRRSAKYQGSSASSNYMTFLLESIVQFVNIYQFNFMSKKLIIATRGSRLAMRQSEIVRDLLLQKFPETIIEFLEVTTKGDIDQTTPLVHLETPVYL